MTSLGLFFVAAFPVMAFRDYERHVDEVADVMDALHEKFTSCPSLVARGGGAALAQLACP
jgi:hypothetical protein